MTQLSLFEARPPLREPVPASENGWYFAVYRGAVCWSGLAQRAPFRGAARLRCPRTGRFGLGDTRDTALADLRQAVAA